MHPHPRYTLSVRALELSCKSFERGSHDFEFATGIVQVGRTSIANHAMAGRCPERHQHGPSCVAVPYEYLLMHDDDLEVTPECRAGNPMDAWHAMMEADPTIGIIGAIYLRESPVMPNVTVPHPQYPEELCHVLFGMPAEPFEVGAIATGFMMVRVSAMNEIRLREEDEGAPPMFRFPVVRTRWDMAAVMGEDYDFCVRMRAAGYRVLADPRFPTVHHKPTGPLGFEHGAWEHGWTQDPIGSANRARDLRAACGENALRMEKIGNFTVLDHTAQRQVDAKAWRGRKAAHPVSIKAA